MSQLPDERAKLSGARTVGAALAIILLAFVVSPQLTRAGNLQRSLTLTTMVFAVVGIGLYLPVQDVAGDGRARHRPGESEADVQHDPGQPAAAAALSECPVRADRHVHAADAAGLLRPRRPGHADYVILLAVLSVGGMFLTAPLIPKIVGCRQEAGYMSRRHHVVGGVGIALSPPSIPVLAFVSFAVYGVGLAVMQALMWTLETDTVEYGEWKTGARTEGSNYALLSFARKVGRDRWGHRGLGDRIRRLCRGCRDAVDHGLGHDPVGHRRGPALFVGFGAAIMLAYPFTEGGSARWSARSPDGALAAPAPSVRGRRYDRRRRRGRRESAIGRVRLSVGLRGGSCRCGARGPAGAGRGGACGELPRHAGRHPAAPGSPHGRGAVGGLLRARAREPLAGAAACPFEPTWTTAADSFSPAEQQLTTQGLPVEAWIVLTHNLALGRRHPDLVVRNAFGDAYPYGLCPAADDVREYCATLVEAILNARCPWPGSSESCGPMGFDHAGEHEKTEFAGWDEARRALLSLCFCRACTGRYAAAGIDVDRLTMVVREGVDAGAGTLEETLGSLAPVVAEIRTGIATELRALLVGRARAVAPGTRLTLHGSADPWATGSFATVRPALGHGVDAVVASCWDVGAGAGSIRGLRELVPAEVEVGGYLVWTGIGARARRREPAFGSTWTRGCASCTSTTSACSAGRACSPCIGWSTGHATLPSRQASRAPAR